MRVTVEGDLEQVTEALGFAPAKEPTPRQTRLKEKKAKRNEFIRRRKVVVDAFKMVRHSEADRADADALLDAIRRTSGVTDDDIKIAHRVIASHN